MKLRIDHAQEAYESKTGERITLAEIAKKVMPKTDPKHGEYLLSRWSHGKRLERVELHHLTAICDLCGTSVDELLGFRKASRPVTYELEEHLFKHYLKLLDTSKHMIEAMTRLNQVHKVSVNFLFDEEIRNEF